MVIKRRQCSKNVAIYQALNLEQKWNLSNLTDTEELDQAIADLKATVILLPQVNFTDDNLNGILIELENALNPTVLNITKLIDYVSGSIIVPDLRAIKEAADTANGEVDLDAEVRQH